MKIRNQTMIVTTLALAGVMSACATTTPPPQLVEARSTYTSSSNGLTAKLSPTELYDAKKELDQANYEYDQHGDTAACRDHAYIAHRKFELADVKARRDPSRNATTATGSSRMRIAPARSVPTPLTTMASTCSIRATGSRRTSCSNASVGVPEFPCSI